VNAFNPIHLRNPKEIRKIRVNPKKIITIKRVKTCKTPVLGEEER
jgi:hypothetical protein